MGKPLSDEALDTIFRTARTYNGFLEKPVSDEQIQAIWDLMKMGPTSANMLPARMVWCTSQEAKERLAKHAMAANGEKILNSPATVIIGMDTNFHDHLPELFPHDPNARNWFTGSEDFRISSAFRNSSMQGAYFLIAARALGLDTGPMSGFSNEAVDAEFFGDQPAVKSNFLSTLGYGDPDSIFERSPRPGFETFNTII
jgi:3-hydroxypropanoate dehydrogenase